MRAARNRNTSPHSDQHDWPGAPVDGDLPSRLTLGEVGALVPAIRATGALGTAQLACTPHPGHEVRSLDLHSFLEAMVRVQEAADPGGTCTQHPLEGHRRAVWSVGGCLSRGGRRLCGLPGIPPSPLALSRGLPTYVIMLPLGTVATERQPRLIDVSSPPFLWWTFPVEMRPVWPPPVSALLSLWSPHYI